MAEKKNEVLGLLMDGKTIKDLCKSLGEKDSLKVSSIIKKLLLERRIRKQIKAKWDSQKAKYFFITVHYLTDEEYQNQMEILEKKVAL